MNKYSYRRVLALQFYVMRHNSHELYANNI